jgi:hypothetical protein
MIRAFAALKICALALVAFHCAGRDRPRNNRCRWGPSLPNQPRGLGGWEERSLTSRQMAGKGGIRALFYLQAAKIDS